jgi:glycosyltransferase involved in cell wall biosynthesis
LLQMVGPDHQRLKLTFFPIRIGRVPQIVSMIRQFVRYKASANHVQPDIVITAGTFLELLMVRLSRRTRKAFKVTWLRTIWVDQKTYRIPALIRPLVRKTEAWLLRGADLILGNGSDIAERYSVYGLKVTVIRNAVDLVRWSAPAPKIASPIRVAFVGRLAIDKGIVEFIEMARRVKSGPLADDFIFDVYGHSGEEALVAKAADAGILIMHGAVNNEALPAVLAELDLCVALTKSDPSRGGGGTSNAMMEQLASGRVMLAWDNMIFRQWLNPDNAYLATQNDVDGLIKQLYEIRLSPENARRRAANGHATVSHFGVDAMMNNFDEALQQAYESYSKTNPLRPRSRD